MPTSRLETDKHSALIEEKASLCRREDYSALKGGPTSRIDEFDEGGYEAQCQYPFVFSGFDVSWLAAPGGNICFLWNTETEKTWKRLRWRKVEQAWNYLNLTEVSPPATSFEMSMENAGRANYEWQAWNRDECDNTQYSETQTFTISLTPFGDWEIKIT